MPDFAKRFPQKNLIPANRQNRPAKQACHFPSSGINLLSTIRFSASFQHLCRIPAYIYMQPFHMLS
jgi:hypothetical protein